uniref:Transporter n=1 Tax=Globodera pallida TaxID=36090 RepID=A0A183CDL3_GLOPA
MANDNILFISGVVLLALAIDFSPAPGCTTVIIFAFYKYRSELYQLLPPEFFHVLLKTRALYMAKLKRWFPDWQKYHRT